MSNALQVEQEARVTGTDQFPTMPMVRIRYYICGTHTAQHKDVPFADAPAVVKALRNSVEPTCYALTLSFVRA